MPDQVIEHRTPVEAVRVALLDADRMLKEPVLANSFLGLVVIFFGELVNAAAYYGLDIDSPRADATFRALASLIPIITFIYIAWKSRNNVYAPATVGRLAEREFNRGYAEAATTDAAPGPSGEL
jgi:hypothetical protein